MRGKETDKIFEEEEPNAREERIRKRQREGNENTSKPISNKK